MEMDDINTDVLSQISHNECTDCNTEQHAWNLLGQSGSDISETFTFFPVKIHANIFLYLSFYQPRKLSGPVTRDYVKISNTPVQ